MRFVTALLLVDLPVSIIVGITGWFYGYADTLTAVMDYRENNLWTWLPPLILMLIVERRRRA